MADPKIQIEDAVHSTIGIVILVCCNPRCLTMKATVFPKGSDAPGLSKHRCSCGAPIIATDDPALFDHANRYNSIYYRYFPMDQDPDPSGIARPLSP